jgi:hypothetical protein
LLSFRELKFCCCWQLTLNSCNLFSQKLREKEEQLKINENTNDRTRLLDRLYQAETRNLELEQTLKTLNQKIDSTGQKDLDTPMGNNKESCDEIILGIREKITRFVLSKVDQELNKLQELSIFGHQILYNYSTYLRCYSCSFHENLGYILSRSLLDLSVFLYRPDMWLDFLLLRETLLL